MKILKPGKLEVRCPSCKTEFEFTPADCFVRHEVCGMSHSGSFDREMVIYVRCPTCKKRVRVTGKVSAAACLGNEDKLCTCPGGFCSCGRDE
jgi:endogenous inhibitor of DNA gyrase (YacG/DUF329 family)